MQWILVTRGEGSTKAIRRSQHMRFPGSVPPPSFPPRNLYLFVCNYACSKNEIPPHLKPGKWLNGWACSFQCPKTSAGNTRAVDDRLHWWPGIPSALATMPETFGVCQQFRIGFGYGFVLISGACPCPMSSSPLSTRLNATRRDSTRLQSAVSCQLSGLAFSPGIADWFGVGFSSAAHVWNEIINVTGQDHKQLAQRNPFDHPWAISSSNKSSPSEPFTMHISWKKTFCRNFASYIYCRKSPRTIHLFRGGVHKKAGGPTEQPQHWALLKGHSKWAARRCGDVEMWRWWSATGKAFVFNWKTLKPQFGGAKAKARPTARLLCDPKRPTS